MRSLLLLVAFVLGLGAGEAPTVDATITQFEVNIAKEFAPVQRSLDQWRERRAQNAMIELQRLFSKATPEDQVVIAYNLLAVRPTHKQARELFSKAGLTPPFDEKGVPSVGWTTPATNNRALAEAIANLAYPPFEAVREAIDPKSASVSGFWKKQAVLQDKLKTDLVDIAKQGQADVVYPLLAYYHPQANEVRMYFQSKNKPVPRQRVWFSPVDQWLLDHELAGIDCLSSAFKPSVGNQPTAAKGEPAFVNSASWEFPASLPACRVECAATWSGRMAFLVTDSRGSGVRVTMANGSALVECVGSGKERIGEFTISFDPATVPMPIQCEIRGKAFTMRVGGSIIGTGTLPRSVAFHRFAVEGNLRASQLRLRYLAELLDNALLLAGPAGPSGPTEPAKPPAEPTWMALRKTELAKKVTFAFTDTSLDEVAGMLTRLSGATFTIDSTAEPLKDLPISMTGNDLPLQTALEWLQRLTDVVAVPTEQGFSLQWKR